MRRTRTFKIAAAVVAGIVLTLVAAWGGALLRLRCPSTDPYLSGMPGVTQSWFTDIGSGLGVARVNSEWWGPEAFVESSPDDHCIHEAPPIPAWAGVAIPTAGIEALAARQVVAEARGWPFVAFSGSVELAAPYPDRKATVTTRGAILLSALPTTTGGSYIELLPLTPVPLGLAADIGVFAFASWIVIAFPGAIVRTWRRHSGRCVQCGHLLGGLTTCPECAFMVSEAV